MVNIIYKIKKILFLIKISKFNFLIKKKYIENYNFEELVSNLKNKKIALIGNSKNLLKKKNWDIDNYDIVIRLNILPTPELKNYLGSRCDILMLSHAPINLLNNSFIKIWMSPKNRHFTNYSEGVVYHYPIKWWNALFEKLNARPSTGAMALDFLVRILPELEIELLGFDHTYENVWYNNIYQGRVHNFEKERLFFEEMINKYNIKYL